MTEQSSGTAGPAEPRLAKALQTEVDQEVERVIEEDDPHRERLLYLTDGVYAIALTLLALDLRLPIAADNLGGSDLLASLIGLAPKLLGYITSFTVIALFWSLTLRGLRHVVRVDGVYVWLTLLHLACIAFIPFPTTVVGEHLGDAVAEEFYFGSLAVTVLVGTVTWWYATSNRRLVRRNLPMATIWHYRLLTLAAFLGVLLLMGFIAAGLHRVIEPLILGYGLTFIFIAEGVRFSERPRFRHESV